MGADTRPGSVLVRTVNQFSACCSLHSTKHPMNKAAFTVILAVALSGCASREEKGMTGTELNTDDKGKSKLVTYVTPEEYERMTPEEREHLHAAVGASVSVPLGGHRAASEPISERDLEKAYSK